MRRSRRKGQLRRVSSLFAGSHSTTRISSLSLDGFRDDLAEGIGDERISPEFQSGVALGLAAFEAHAIDDRDINAVGDGVSALNGAPGIELRCAELALSRADAIRCWWDRK